jgi:DNA-binding NarL/FixJ family response regulator
MRLRATGPARTTNCGRGRERLGVLLRTLKVVVADDHALVISAIRAALETAEDIEIVGQATSGAAVIPLVDSTKPDFLLLDVRMPQMDGITCLERIAKRFPDLKVIMLSATADDPEIVRAAFARGARAFVGKHVEPRDLASVIRLADQSVVQQPFGLLDESQNAPVDTPLTDSQVRVLQALVRGLSNKEIARELWLSEQTVKFHLSNIYRVLDVASRAEAIRYAYEHALVENPLFERV